ncbi:MAG: hypothetical protein NTX65_08285 [Ignavibacteriales bacterium]|nr:hypothetical protein [Ignavibacteriales bacterium]
MKTILFFLVTITVTFNIDAQSNKVPCSEPEASQFDFWIGSWNLEWKDKKGDIQHGTNTVIKILGSCVIEENFVGPGATPYLGRSMSVFSTNTNKWQQTWVDNQGGYLDFIGEFKDGKMILSRSFTINNVKTIQRMVYYNITKDSFNWNWENSTDDGKTWNLLWQISYKRKS